MQITLGKRGDYAVRAALYLARHAGDGWCKARAIALDMAIPATYLPQVLGDLVRHRLAESLAGPHGGYRLARAPEAVSLLEVVEAAGGPVRSRECILRGGPCRWEGTCAVHDAWSDAQSALVERLRAVDLAALAGRDEELAHSAAMARLDDERLSGRRSLQTGTFGNAQAD